jgi:phosphohistidine phosphatase
MNIYLMRHGIAAEQTDAREEIDRQRPLTSEGRDRVKIISRALVKLELRPAVILSSPYVRAEQTASILAEEMRLKKQLEFTDVLVPLGQPGGIIDEIIKHSRVDEIILVGHYPSLGWLMAAFLGFDPGESLALKKGGVCCFSAENLEVSRAASLDWLLTPKILLKV